MPIYTRTGDTGETSLFGGKRVPKNDPIVDVYGSIDELNSWVGFIASEIFLEEIKRNSMEKFIPRKVVFTPELVIRKSSMRN